MTEISSKSNVGDQFSFAGILVGQHLLTSKIFSSKSMRSGEHFEYLQLTHICCRSKDILHFLKKIALLVTLHWIYQIRHARASRFRGEVRWVWTFHFKKSCHMPSLARVSTNPIFEAKKLEFVVFLGFVSMREWR